MAVTSDSVFTNYSQSASGATWQNIQFIVDPSANEAYSTLSETGVSLDISRYMILDTPLSGAEVPPGPISNLKITVRMRADINGTQVRYRDLSVAGGTSMQGFISESFEDYVLSGDLAFWGVTAQEMRDFADGLETFTFRMDNEGPAVSTARVQWAKAQFTYPSAESLVAVPALF